MTGKMRKYKSLLGISFEDKRMSACFLRLADNRLTVQKTLNTALTLDLLNSDPELMGRELQKHLEDAGIREKRCVVSLPAQWMLSLQTELPQDLSSGDEESFIRIQSEREFPFSPEDLSISVSSFQPPQGHKQALIVAVPSRHVAALQKVLKSAGLHPLSMTLGIASLLDMGTPSGVAGLLFNENGVDMMIAGGRGFVALRSLPEAVEESPEGKVFDSDLVIRELRITLGQISSSLKDSVQALSLFGAPDGVRSVSEKFRQAAAGMNLSVDRTPLAERFPLANPEALARISPVSFAVAARFLLGAGVGFEFLPPRSSWSKKIASRMSARYTLWLAGAALALILVLGTAFLVQYFFLSHFRKKWDGLAPDADRIQTLMDKTRIYRPWYDDSIQSLSIIRKITQAFPEGSSVWMKTLEIKELSKVSCSGEARTSKDWLEMLERLQKSKGIRDLQVLQVRGNAPLQFTFTFRWSEVDSDGI